MPRNRKKFYTQDNADFMAGFIQGAKQYHGLEIDYLRHLERDPARQCLDQAAAEDAGRHGLSAVGIIACDDDRRPGGWRIVDELRKDAELKRAIYAVGVHYPKSQSTAAAQAVRQAALVERGQSAVERPGLALGPGRWPRCTTATTSTAG